MCHGYVFYMGSGNFIEAQRMHNVMQIKVTPSVFRRATHRGSRGRRSSSRGLLDGSRSAPARMCGLLLLLKWKMRHSSLLRRVLLLKRRMRHYSLLRRMLLLKRRMRHGSLLRRVLVMEVLRASALVRRMVRMKIVAS